MFNQADLVFAPANGNDRDRTLRALVEKEIQRRDGCGCCFYCGAPNGNVLEHVTPRGRHGGSAHVENLVLACSMCNFLKGDAPGWFFVIWKDMKRPGTEYQGYGQNPRVAR